MDLKNVEKLSKLFEEAINNQDKGYFIIVSIPDEESPKGTYKTMLATAHIPKEQLYFLLHKCLMEIDNINCKTTISDEKKEIKF